MLYTINYTLYTFFLSFKYAMLLCPSHNFQNELIVFLLVKMSLCKHLVVVSVLDFMIFQWEIFVRPSDYILWRLVRNTYSGTVVGSRIVGFGVCFAEIMVCFFDRPTEWETFPSAELWILGKENSRSFCTLQVYPMQ